MDPVVKWIGGGIEERKVDFSCIGEGGIKVFKMTEGGFKNINLISFPLYLFINIQCVCYTWGWDGLKNINE